ncbi:MAG TPA: hypothetical protein VD948_07125 [Rhodothermales bacterium]|nr:hypothetical protein [Rhodothermales bacterium]
MPHPFFRLTLAALLVVTAAGCQSAMMSVGKLAARFLTQKTDDLSAANVQVAYTDRSVPAASGNAGPIAYGRGYRDETPIVNVVMPKRRGMGMWALDGTVTANGAAMETPVAGAYSAWLAPNAPVTVALTSKKGQTETFQVQPRAPIRIRSINGQARGSTVVNLNGPLVIELDRPAADDTEIRIGLQGRLMTMSDFWGLAIVKGQNRIELPAAVFENGYGNPIDTGENWIVVEEYVRPRFRELATGGLSLVSVKSADYWPVTVMGDVPRKVAGQIAHEGISVSGEAGGMRYTASKPRAFMGPAMQPGKRLAVVTFAVRAIGLSQSQTTSSTSYGLGTITTTTTTRTRQFAQLPSAFWQNLTGTLHDDLMGGLRRAWNVDVVPVERVKAEPLYARLEPIVDTTTVSFASHSYRDLRVLFDGSLASAFTDNNGAFQAARVERLLDALSVDGLVVATVDLQMPWESFSLNPRIRFDVLGRQSDPMQASTAYFARVEVTGPGREVTNEMLEDPAQLSRFLETAVNRTGVVAAFNAAMQALVAEEARHPIYRTVWQGR